MPLHYDFLNNYSKSDLIALNTKLISMLIEDDALTVPAMEHVLDLLFENIVKKATGLSASKAFKLERSSISLTPEFAARVKKKSLASALTDSQVDLPF